MKTIITIIRTAIGWHCLYEGCIKLFADKWLQEAPSILQTDSNTLSKMAQISFA